MKKHFSLILFACIFAANSANINAQFNNFKAIEATVGKQPVAVIPAVKQATSGNHLIPNFDTLNIICMGYNANFDGIFNPETDELPSWWKIEGVINASPNSDNPTEFTVRKVMDFENNWGGFFPYRFDYTIFNTMNKVNMYNRFLYIPYQNSIKWFNKSTEELEFTDNDRTGATSMFRTSNHTAVSMREYDSESWIPTANYVRIFDNENNILLDTTISTGNNVQRVIGFNTDNYTNAVVAQMPTFAVLCEHNYGEISTIEFYQIVAKGTVSPTPTPDAIKRIATMEIGKGGNEILLLSVVNPAFEVWRHSFLFAISNGDSKISIIDAKSLELYDYEDQNMAGYFDNNVIQLPENSMPREMSIKEAKVGTKTIYSAFISTNSNKIFYLPDLRKTSEFIEIETPKNSEGILNIKQDGVIAAYTNIYGETAFFTQGNTVTILYEYENSISEISNMDFIVFPNPIGETVNIFLSQNSEIKSIKMLDILGATVQEISNYNQTENLIQFKLNSKLNSGKYFIQIETVNGILTQSVVIQ